MYHELSQHLICFGYTARLACSIYYFKPGRAANHGKVVQKHLSKLMTHQTEGYD